MNYQNAQKEIFNLLGYDPTEAQQPIHDDESRVKEVGGGERGGKSVVGEKELAKHYWTDILAQSKKNALYWLIGANYSGCRGEWNYAVEDFTKLEILARPPTRDIDPGEIVLQDGTRIVTKSARYPEMIATEAPDGIVICEAGQVDHEVFLRCLGRVGEKRGWIVMGGTFEEEEYTGWYKEYFDLGRGPNSIGLKSFSLPSWSNLVIYPGGRNDPEILRLEASMTPERFQERHGGLPCPKTGRVVLEFNNAIHVREIPFNPTLPVYLAIDPGYGGAFAVLAIQEYEQYTAVFDEIYVTGEVTQSIIENILEQKEWYGMKGKNIAGGAIDIEGIAHHGMPAPYEIFTAHGIFLAYKKIFVEDGIDLLRVRMRVNALTHEPKLIINPKCRGIISEMGGCKSPVEGGGIWMRNKNTNKAERKNDHACKALIYYLANKYGFVDNRQGLNEPLRFKKRRRRPTFTAT